MAYLERPGLVLAVVLSLLASVCILLGVSSGIGLVCDASSTKTITLGRRSLPASGSHSQAVDAKESWQPYASTTTAASARAVLQKHFPQITRCAAGTHNWQMEYAALHSSIAAGKALPRYVTNVAIRKGTADRVTGWVSMFYLALLSNRAITTTFKDPLPGFEAACDMPYINWTHPFIYPDGALDLADLYYKGMSEDNPERAFPKEGPINSTFYNMTYVVNQPMQVSGSKFSFFHDQNLTSYPASNEEVPYVIAASNRGQTYKLALNPYHKQRLWSFGLTPETTFMCGFFYLCSPNSNVQELYKPYWDTLSRPGLLKIGIMARVGDHVLRGNAETDNATAIQFVDGPGDVYFRCAAALEKAFKVPGQEVVWYLMSDSLAFRQAAKNKFGTKVLTDLDTKVVHPDCQSFNPGECHMKAMNRSLQHSIGQLFTYSLADYHIHTSLSGFGRLGAWASGKRNNLFEIANDKQECDPHKPTSHQHSADTWSLV